ncbi:MAG: insulinase family protein [Rhodothermia bacterium]|nr:insulinase family protein [Rhodothermia bacterium]
MRRQVDKRQIITGPPPEFARSVLDNGVRVVTETIPSVRSVSVGVWVFAGSRDEPKSLNGISHLIEHMVFKGTRRRRTHHIAHRMESVGGYLNAFTGKEYTCFYARSLDEHLERAIDTVCDLVLFPSFPSRELTKEKEVVLEEMKMYEDAPEDLVFDHFEGATYHGHSLARPVIGTPRTLHSIDREDLLRFVDRHYTPNRIVLSVAGNARHGDVVRLAQRAFEGATRRSRPVRRRKVPSYAASEVVVDRPISQAHLVLGLRALGAADDGRVPLAVLNTILGGGMSSRLNQNIREKYGYCYQVYSFLNMHSDAGDFGVYMGTDADRVDRSRKLILRELDRLRQKPVSARTLSSAKSQVKGAIMLGLEGMSNRMMRLGRQELYYQKYYSLDQVIDEIEAITADDVQSIAQELFDPERLSTVIVRPSSKSQIDTAT